MKHHNTQSKLPVTKELMFCRNQDAPRNYTQVMLCFATEGDAKLAVDHLRSSVKFLQTNYPFFNARLAPGYNPYRLYLSRSPEYELPFIESRHTDTTYEELRGRRFTVEDLCGKILANESDADAIRSWTNPDPDFVPEGEEEHQFPATLVHAVALDKGGLIVRLHVHHALFDGTMRSHFIDCLAAATRRETLPSPSRTSFPFDYDRSQPFKDRLAACPELYCVPSSTYPAPTSPPAPNLYRGGRPHDDIAKTSKVFVFSAAKARELRELIWFFSSVGGGEINTEQQPLSSYACVSALAFAHVVKARLRGEGYRYLPKEAHAPQAILHHEVDFRKRAFVEHMEDYFGNATVSVWTRVAQELALNAAGATGKEIGDGEEYLVEDFHDDLRKTKDLAALAYAVKQSIDAVDEDYVRARLAVAETGADPRRLGLDYDPRQPQVLGCNNWRHTGGKEAWDFPSAFGASSKNQQEQMPEAFRLARGYSMRNALILPQRQGTDDQDVLVSLSENAMAELLQDAGWMGWVSEVRD